MNDFDILVKKFSKEILEETRVPLITIYNSPRDYPNKYMARLFDLDAPTKIIMVFDDISEVYEYIPRGMVYFPRFPDDDPCIVGVYL